MTDTPKYVSLDGAIVPWAEGNVHITSSAFKYGCAVFEGLRGYWNAGDQQLYVFRADDHARRLVNAQRFQRFDTLFDATSQTTAMVDLLRALDLREDVQILVHAYVSGGGLPASTRPQRPGDRGNPLDHSGAPRGRRQHPGQFVAADPGNRRTDADQNHRQLQQRPYRRSPSAGRRL